MSHTGLRSTAREIETAAAFAAFGKPLVTNVFRGLVAEAVVAQALGSSWRWCSEDYAAWDFERADGKLLEVKQSAARQSWKSYAAKPADTRFDIAGRTGRWDGPDWLRRETVGRWAHVYVFAWHGETDDHADHRDPSQWCFYVVGADRLPDQKSIGLNRLRTMTPPCSFGELATAVATALAEPTEP